MNEEKILDALQDIKDDYILEAAPPLHKKHKSRWLPGLGLAACLAAALFAGSRYFSPSSPEPLTPDCSPLPLIEKAEPDASLPVLSTSENIISGCGYEGYIAYNVSELLGTSPWREGDKITTLPAYHNSLTMTEPSESLPRPYWLRIDKGAIRAKLLAVAERFGLDPDKLVIQEPYASIKPYEHSERDKLSGLTEPEKSERPYPEEELFDLSTCLTAQQNGVTVEVDVHLSALAEFEPAIPLPEELRFAIPSEPTPEELAAAGRWLLTEHGEWFGLEDPQMSICGDYGVAQDEPLQENYKDSPEEPLASEKGSPERLYFTGRLSFFEGNGSPEERLLNRSLYSAHVLFNEEGELCRIRFGGAVLSERLGNYPILTEEEARAELLAGRYITSVPYDFPGEKQIGGVELMYRCGKSCLPYYRYYVELPEAGEYLRENTADRNIKDYGAYYVPAIPREYLSDLPVYDGSFNSVG